MNKSIIIIGAGIAGLSAGCYARMNGYKTSIFEMDNARTGGLCTSWSRKGYTMVPFAFGCFSCRHCEQSEAIPIYEIATVSEAPS